MDEDFDHVGVLMLCCFWVVTEVFGGWRALGIFLSPLQAKRGGCLLLIDTWLKAPSPILSATSIPSYDLHSIIAYFVLPVTAKQSHNKARDHHQHHTTSNQTT